MFNDDNFFSATASLLLFLDSRSTQVTGAVTKNTLTSPSPVVSENLQGTSTVTGTINVAVNRNFTIAGYVHTSHGKVTTTVSAQQNFSGTQTIDFDTVNGTVLDQKTDVENSVSSAATVSGDEGTVVTQDNFSFPITVDFIFPVSSSPFGFTVTTGQKYQRGQGGVTRRTCDRRFSGYKLGQRNGRKSRGKLANIYIVRFGWDVLQLPHCLRQQYFDDRQPWLQSR